MNEYLKPRKNFWRFFSCYSCLVPVILSVIFPHCSIGTSSYFLLLSEHCLSVNVFAFCLAYLHFANNSFFSLRNNEYVEHLYQIECSEAWALYN